MLDQYRQHRARPDMFDDVTPQGWIDYVKDCAAPSNEREQCIAVLERWMRVFGDDSPNTVVAVFSNGGHLRAICFNLAAAREYIAKDMEKWPGPRNDSAYLRPSGSIWVHA